MRDVTPLGTAGSRITPRLVESLYTEAMLLADEARTYFDAQGRAERDGMDPFVRVGFACESLKVTTRLMHIIAWLLTQRAVETGELTAASGRRTERRLGHAGASDPAVVEQLPRGAQALVECGQVHALMHGRLHLSIEDIQAVAPAVLRHRVILNFDAHADGQTPETLLAKIIPSVAAPAGARA